MDMTKYFLIGFYSAFYTSPFYISLGLNAKSRILMVNSKQEAEVAWKLTTIKKNFTRESNFWIDFKTMRR